MSTLNVALAFVEGVGLVLSPCILPILPLVLAASLDGGKRRPIGIICGFILAFAGFGLLSRQILEALHADPQIIRDVALVLLMLFGIVMLSQKLSDRLIGLTQNLANVGQNLTSRWDQTNGFWGGVAVGCLIGLIWTPCAGPVMAAAIVQIIQAHTNLEASLTVVMFALGAGLPMLIIALAGRKIMDRLRFLKTHSHVVRRTLGVIIIGVAILIYCGADVKLLAAAAPAPSPQTATQTSSPGALQKALDAPYAAPDIAPGQWFNSAPLTMEGLRGKVVLVDFWTYSCINCVRTLPFITSWDEKYRDKGLVIIGIHSPEFDFEKKSENVEAALSKNNIHYPVVLDNQLESWKNFNNHYWPAHYLINQDGQVIYTHFGEGDYDVTENNIRFLLGLDRQSGTVQPPQTSTESYKTPETYLGFARAQNYTGVPLLQNEKGASYHSSNLPADHWGLDGQWKVESQRITGLAPNVHLHLNFTARHVFLVMGTADGKPKTVMVKLNNADLGENAGKDVANGVVTIDKNTLYELVDQKTVKSGLLDITSSDSQVEMYAFTFGN